MIKRIFLACLLVAAFSLSAFAGEGSDTIGACKLMPELRYSYYETPLNVDHSPISNGRNPVNLNWKEKGHIVDVQLNWGVIDNLDLYGFVGARIASELEGTASDINGPFGVADTRWVFDFGTNFVCGVGAKGTFYRSPNGLYLGGGASFTYSQTNGMRDLKGYFNDIYFGDSMSEGVYFEETNYAITADLHAGWYLKKIGLTPYLGVEYRWNRAYLKERDITQVIHNDFTYSEKNPVGVYVGVDYLIKDKLYLNLEGHMVNRWGGSVSVGYLFDICGKSTPVAPAPEPVKPEAAPTLTPMSMK